MSKQDHNQSELTARSEDGQFAQCPYCSAIFRVPVDKLTVRDGEVRCGVCREIFSALDQKVFPQAGGGFAATPDTSEGVDTSLSYPKDLNEGEVESLEDNDSSEIAEENSVSTIITNNFQEARGFETNEPGNNAQTNDAYENAVIEQASDDGQEPKVKIEAEPTAENIDSRGPVGSWSIYQELEVEDAVLDTYMEGRSLQNSASDSRDLLFDLVEEPTKAEWFNAEPDSLYDNNPFTKPADGQRPSSISMSGVDEYIADRPNPLVGIFWTIVCLFFIGLLGLQVKYYFVEKFAQDDSYRPYLTLFCRVASCELPARRDAYRFTITNTRIDLHPREPGALRITVKLLNQANFTQPYPQLQLTLTDRVGRVVGRRTFTAGAYLQADQQKLLGSGELGSVAFDLAHPHEKAVGFVVDIVKNSGA